MLWTCDVAEGLLRLADGRRRMNDEVWVDVDVSMFAESEAGAATSQPPAAALCYLPWRNSARCVTAFGTRWNWIEAGLMWQDVEAEDGRLQELD